jgi:hypothetical protein
MSRCFDDEWKATTLVILALILLIICVLSVMGLYLSHALPVDLFRPYACSPKGHR